MAGNTSQYLFFCSKENISLAQAELERVFSSSFQELAPGTFLSSADPRSCSLSRFAYLKEAYVLLETVPLTDILTLAPQLQTSYKISLIQDKKYFSSTQELANQLYSAHPKPKISLENPDHSYTFFIFADKVYLGELLSINTDTPHQRRAHHKKHLHPTSLHPKLAKAMINLAGVDCFHDPFCGVGGIVYEGRQLGFAATGSDIVSELVVKANENIGADSCFVADATTLQRYAPAYVSDLPYGKNSLLSEKKELLYKKFLQNALSQTTCLVLGTDASVDFTTLTSEWEVLQTHVVYVHKSLTRKISLLVKK